MIILGIETSCDETAAALVEETGDPQRPWRVRSSVVASQVDLHREWGGIVPELSARQHVRDICGVVARALGEGGGTYDAVAVTQGPGLVGSLLVGLSFAKSLAWSRRLPLIPVHHLAGHIESLVLANGEMPRPAVASWCREGTPACIASRPGAATSCSAGRGTMRRARRRTRWPSSWASGTRAVRSSTGSPRAATIAR
jgi:hypothetical protein